MFQRVRRSVSRAEDFDIEPLEQRARAEFRRREFCGDLIVDALCRFAGQFLFDAED